jgi:hypothetical protein
VELFDNYIKPNPVAVPGTEIDVEYYLGRVDRLYVQNRNANTQGSYFLLDQGIPDVIPKAPNDKSSKDTQLIATIGINPYTATANDVKIVYANFPRYTMNDVYNIDKRLTSLEKTVKKNSIDIVALNNKVFDRSGTTGNILYPTGILVDDFSGYGTSWVSSPYFTAAVDPIRKECRPAFSAHVYNLFFVSTPTGVSTLNDLTVFNYTEESFVDQSIASDTLLEVNPAGIVNSAGRATIYPSTINTNGGGNSTVDFLAKIAVEAVPAQLLTNYVLGTYGKGLVTTVYSTAADVGAVDFAAGLAAEDVAAGVTLGVAGAAALAVDYAYNKIPIVKNTVKGVENLVTSVFKGLGF